MQDRFARSTEIVEEVTKRCHRIYPGGAVPPTDLGKMRAGPRSEVPDFDAVSYTHLRAHETSAHL
eukprot:3070037-Alexandrium_andersonii.AAC.1